MTRYVYSFLNGEMVKKNLTPADLGRIIGIQDRTMRNKLHGKVDFTWSEVCKISEVFPQFTKEQLFQKNQ